MTEFSETLKPYWKIALGCILAVVAIAIFFWGNHVIESYQARSMASQEWPTVDGKIIESRIEEHISADDDGDTITYYEVVITYQYFVNDARYSSDRLDWEDNLNRETITKAKKLADSYLPGKTVVVHYDPNEPEFGLLDVTLPERPNDAGIRYFIASGAIVAIALALVYAHFGILLRIPGGAIIAANLLVFICGGILTLLNIRFAVLIGFGFVSFVIGGFVRGHRQPADK